MKKINLLILSSIFSASLSYGQAHINTLTPSPIWSAEASFLNPSYLKNNNKISINIAPLMGANFNLRNNFISAGGAIRLFEQTDNTKPKSFAPVHELMDNLQKLNTVDMSTDLTLLHIGFKVGKPEKALNFGLSVRQHIYAKFTVNDDFYKLVYGGNKQFAGQKIFFEPNLNFMSYTDIGFAVSKTVKLTQLQITPAVRFRYLLGEASLITKGSNLALYTQQDGEYLELTGQIKGQAGGMLNFDNLIKGNTDSLFEMSEMFNSLGKGVGIDIGANIAYKNMSLNLGLVDNGSITYAKKNAVRITSTSANVRWEGYDIIGSAEGVEYNSNLPSLDSLKIETESEAFTTSLGTKLTLNGNYGLIEKKDKKDNLFYKHNVGLSYIQGISNHYNASTAPYVSLYYLYNFKNKFTIGANYNHYRSIDDLGANIGFRLAGFKLGLGTNSLFATFNRDFSKQADFFFYLGLGF